MNDPTKIRLSVNGEAIEMPAGVTIADLLTHLKISSRAIAVELNQEIRPSDQFPKTILQAGDSLEVVTLVGGG